MCLLWRLLCAVTAFARRCHGVYCVRVELSLTASNGVFFFFLKIDEKNMQILNMTKANKTLFKSDAHTCIRIFFTMSIEQQAGLLLVYMQAQQIQIAADAASIVL